MVQRFREDLYRINGRKMDIFEFIIQFIKRYEVRFLYFYRKNGFINNLFERRLRNKYHLEFFSKNIGGGLYLPHPYNITINGDVVIGNNCNISNGVTIGCEPRGKRKGIPNIGNNVWIGSNAVIVGKIKIEDNVLIAPNAFINMDVPSNSIVFGNPAVIKHRENAVEKYINNSYVEKGENI